jgi:MFS family permease
VNSAQPKLRFGPVLLAAGISRGNAWTLLLASFVSVGFLSFVNIGQAYVLNANLGIPGNEQGGISGYLAAWSEVVVLCVIGVFGVLSDRIGRRPIVVVGVLIVALAYVVYPLAGAEWHLFVARSIYAIGIAAMIGMMGTLIHDYADDRSRGKMIALTGIFNGIGVVTVSMVFGRAPEFFVSRGLDDIAAGRYSLWLVALVLVPCAVVLLKGLKSGTAVRHEERPPVRDLAIGGLRAAKNPRIALAYFSAFVSRSDFVVIGTFTVLWATVAGMEQGLTAAQAVQQGAMLFVLANTAGMLWMPVMGFIIDRVNRTTALSFGAAVAALAFGGMGFVEDPLSRSAMPWFAMLGVGQTSCFFASQALIGQEANIKERGSVIGMFGFCGAVGILLATSIGGQLFDSWRPSAPYVLISIANAMVFVFALIVRFLAPGTANPP